MIGANIAVFSLANALPFKPLPFSDADRLALVQMEITWFAPLWTIRAASPEAGARDSAGDLCDPLAIGLMRSNSGRRPDPDL